MCGCVLISVSFCFFLTILLSVLFSHLLFLLSHPLSHLCRGRPRKSWLECVNDDIKTLGLKREITQDRTEWRLAIIHGNV